MPDTAATIPAQVAQESTGVRGLTSVVVVNFEAGPLLERGLGAALASESPVEVIVVDNASGDDSLDRARAAHAGDDRVRIIRNTENVGFARACNQGLAVARGEYLLVLNPDAWIEPQSIAGLVSALDAVPRAGMAGPLLLNPDGSEQVGGRRVLPTPGRTWRRAFGLSGLARNGNDFVLAGDPLPPGPVEIEAISGACMLVRRSALAEVGALDEGYFFHCEDLDWCHRFRQAGWRVVFTPAARVVHDKGTSSRGRPVWVQWHLHRGMLRYYRKFLKEAYPRPLHALVVVGVWARFGAVAATSGVKQSIVAARRRIVGSSGDERGH